MLSEEVAEVTMGQKEWGWDSHNFLVESFLCALSYRHSIILVAAVMSNIAKSRSLSGCYLTVI